MYTYTAIIVDDEPDARKLLRMLLQSEPEIKLVGEADDVNSAMQIIESMLPDIIFLDIEMPGESGFDLIRHMQLKNIRPEVIFVTAYNQYVIEAIRANAFDYLMKPVDSIQLRKSINRLKCKQKQDAGPAFNQLLEYFKKPPRIKLYVRSGFVIIEPDDILYLVADGNYTDIYLKNGNHEVSSINLSHLIEELPRKDFLRISRSTCINLAFLVRMNRIKHLCTMGYGDQTIELTISRRYMKPVEMAVETAIGKR